MAMTLRERLMTTLRGGQADRIPWNIYAWLLPQTPEGEEMQSAAEIHAYTLDLLRRGAPGGRLVLGCTEDFPVSDFAKTYNAIGQALADYEGYPW
ncbi:MAG: hypothetical protein ACUVT2_11225 [Thiobacillaceae bacterium]